MYNLFVSSDTDQLLEHFHSHVSSGERKVSNQSVFTLKTEEASAKQYFQVYSFLSQQQNMMQVCADWCVCSGIVWVLSGGCMMQVS